MKKSTFLNHEKALIIAMVQAYTPNRVKELIDACFIEGAEGFGMQFCRMKNQKGDLVLIAESHNLKSTYFKKTF